MTSVYFLHVEADGSVQLFKAEPEGLRSLRVERVGDEEFTRTWSKSPYFTVPERWYATQPPGDGWILHEDHESQHFSVWRRPARREVM